ncbi:MAG: lipoyl(octanoyl) transferase LipB [Litorimonas sp.]
MVDISKLQTNNSVDWHVSQGLTPYPDALAFMEARVQSIAAGHARELIWLLEHPPLYTAGTTADASDLITPNRFDVFKAGRGGQYTYHGPGQRVAYVMLDLRSRGRSVASFIAGLEQWLIQSLDTLDVSAERREGRVGVWVEHDDGREEKIAAIGVRLRRWVSFHGISLNVSPDLSHFSGIVPCGISEHGVTSLKALGKSSDMAHIDDVLRARFEDIFSPIKLIETLP